MATSSGSASIWPSSTGVAFPSTRILAALLVPCGAAQIATLVLPNRAAIALFTVASGQVGAPDTCRVWTEKPGATSASVKSPAAWKS